MRTVSSIKKLKELITKVEDTPISPQKAVLTFLCIVFIRYQLEMLFESRFAIVMHPSFYQNITDLVHVVSAWFCVYLLLVFTLRLVGNVPLANANRVALFAFPIICIPPVVDVLLGTRGEILYQTNFDELLSSYLGLFNPYAEVNYVTLGVRIEIFVGIVMLWFYYALSGRPNFIPRALISSFIVYTGVFCLGFLPAIWAYFTGSSDQSLRASSILSVSGAKSAFFWYLPLLFFSLFWLAKSFKAIWIVVASCIRPSRLVFYLSIYLYGVYLASETGLGSLSQFNIYDIIVVVCGGLAITFAFIGQVALNDVSDLAIDKMTNPTRPLAAGASELADYQLVMAGSSILALVFAAMVNEVFVFTLVGMMAVGYVYSSPPFRARRWLGIAHGSLTLIGLLSLLSGYVLVHENMALHHINQDQFFIIGALFFIGSHFKDIKDVKGDSALGIVTLSTFFSPKIAYWLVGFFINVLVVFLLLNGQIDNGFIFVLTMSIFNFSLIVFSKKSESMFAVMLICFALLILQ